MRPHALPRNERLTRRADFHATFDARRSAADARLIVYVRPNGLDVSRIGRSVSGKWGNACERNRFRRRVLEAFRLHKHELPRGWDVIVLPRRGISLTLDEITESLKALTARLCGPTERGSGQ